MKSSKNSFRSAGEVPPSRELLSPIGYGHGREASMPIEQCRNIILLYRLRARARGMIEANQKAGNATVAQIYTHIDDWLERQMAYAVSGGRRSEGLR